MPQAIIPFLIKLVVSVAISYAVGKIQANKMKKSMMSALKEKGQQLQVAFDPIAPHQIIYGTARVGGVRAYVGTNGTDNKYLNFVNVLSGCEVTGIDTVLFDDKVAFTNGGIAASWLYSGSAGQMAYCWTGLGSPTQTANPSMVSAFSPAWTYNHRLQGRAYVACQLKFDENQNLFPSMPNVTAIVRGKKVYDPRDGQTKFSSNPILVAYDYCKSYLDYTDDVIDIDSVIAGANICDESVPVTAVAVTGDITAGSNVIYTTQARSIPVGYHISGSGLPAGTTVNGYDTASYSYITVTNTAFETHNHWGMMISGSSTTEKRYTLNGAFSLDSTPQTILENMMATCRGYMTFANGKWSFYAGAYYPPAITITEDDIIGEIQVATHATMRDSYNGVRGVYSSPANLYQPCDFPPYQSSYFLELDGGVEAYTDLDLTWVSSVATAQRIARAELLENRLDLSCNLKVKFGAYRLRVGDNVKVTLPRHGWDEKVFSVEGMTVNTGEMTVQLQLKETSSEIYNWSASDAQVVESAPNSNLTDPRTQNVPTNMQVTAGSTELVRLNTGEVFPRAKITWTNDGKAETTEIQHKPSTSGEWLFAGMLPTSVGSKYYITNVVEGNSWDFRIRHFSPIGVPSAWVYYTTNVSGKTEPPLAPSNVQVTSFSGSIFLRWSNNLDIDLDYDRTRVLASPINDVNTAISIIETSADAYTYIDDEAGQFYFWLQNIDTTGNESTKTGSFTGNTSGIIGQPGTPGVDAYSFNFSRETLFAKLDERYHLLPSFTLSGSLATTVTAYKGTSSLTPVASYLDVGPGKFAISLQNYNYVTVGKTSNDTYEVTQASNTKGDFKIRVYFEAQSSYMDKTVQFNGVIDQLPASTPKYKIMSKVGSATPPYSPLEPAIAAWMSDEWYPYTDMQFCVLQAVGGAYGNVRTGSVHLVLNGNDVGYDYTALNVPTLGGLKLEAKDSRTGEVYDTVYIGTTGSSDNTPFDYWRMLLSTSGSSDNRSWNVKKVGTNGFIWNNGSADNVIGYGEGVQKVYIYYSDKLSFGADWSTGSLYFVKWDNITSRYAVISSSFYGTSPLTINVTGTDTNVLTFHCTASNGSTFRKQLFATRTEPMDTITILSKVQTVTGSNVSTYNVNEYNATSGYTSASYATEYIRQRFVNGTWSSAQPVTRLGSQWYYNSATQPIGMGYVDYHFDTASGFFNVLSAVYPTGSNVGLSYTDNNPCVTATFNWLGTAQTLSALAVDSGSIGPSGSAGEQGPNGSYYKNLYIRAANQPATPTGSSPVGWTTYIPDGGSPVWVITGRFDGVTNLIIGSWSTPNRWSGPQTFIESFFPDPASYDLINNDLLIHTGQFNKIYRYYNGSWLDAQRKVSWEDVNTGSILIADAAVVGTAVINNAAIQDLAVTNAKIATGSIGEANIRDASITNAKIVSLGAEKIAAGTISSVKLATSYIAGNVKVYNTEDESRTFPTTAHVFKGSLSGSTSSTSLYVITSDDLIFNGWKNGPTGFLSARYGHPDLRMDMTAFAYITATGTTAGDWMQFGPAFRILYANGTTGSWDYGQGWIDRYVGNAVDAGSVALTSPVNYNGALDGTERIQLGCRFTFWGRTTGTISTNNLNVSARIYSF